MMDAVKFIKERDRMCKSFDGECKGCPAFNACEDEICCAVGQESTLDATAQIAIVEKWSASHPAITRADLFKKAHPKASTDENGTLVICPKFMDEDFRCPVGVNCWQCRKEFWMQEVE